MMFGTLRNVDVTSLAPRWPDPAGRSFLASRPARKGSAARRRRAFPAPANADVDRAGNRLSPRSFTR
ncbi:hypothetical protein OH687_01000 [Burkholderia anthina]|nr:hypothetical protein OH687_01000 [Burkholderia anthina]